MSKISNNPGGSKPFQWSKLAGKLNKGAKPKSETWIRKPFKRKDSSSSSSSSDQETRTRVSARQRQLLKGTRIPGDKYSVDKLKLKNVVDRARWLKSARQTELIRSGSNSSIPSAAEKEHHPSSALSKEWPSTAHRRKLKDTSKSEWNGSAGSREYPSDGARDSAESVRKSESRADLLVEAVRFGRKRHIKLLLDGGSDPNTTDHEGVTPLIAAVVDVEDKILCHRLMQLLLDAGADPNVGDCNKTTPLMHAADNDCYESAVKLLQHENTDPGLQNNDGFSALMFAANKGFTNIVLLILASFNKVHQVTYLGQQNCEGQTALDLATKKGHTDVSNLLKSEVPQGCPKGFTGFIANTHHLSRTPTPTDSFDSSDEDYSDEELYSIIQDKSFRPSTPLDIESLDNLSLNYSNTRNLAFVNQREEDSSNPGSGNEADTESLMDGGDQLLESDSDIEGQSKFFSNMSSPAIKSHPSSAGISSPRVSPLVSSDRSSQQPMKILSASGNLLVDRNALEKFKDINNSFLTAGPARKDGSHVLNPLVKITLPSPIKGKPIMSNDGMPKLDVFGGNKTLNKSIKNLIQDDFEIRPGHRPPTPARPSLPTLLGGKQESSPDTAVSCCPTEALGKNRRVTLAGFPRSTCESKPSTLSHTPKSPHEDDLNSEILNTSTKSEGWDSMWGHRGRSTVFHSEGHVVPLPPIGHTGTSNLSDISPQSSFEHKESVLTVAKKTLERLETVLSPSEKMHKKNKNVSRSRTVRQLKTSP